ncbi:MAG TPA: M42 family metallopeptidase, partial [Thermoanaerobacterales bacterium]|nr:M42 family metallopeptidase [Thermoanaerobacterales bacterium]
DLNFDKMYIDIGAANKEECQDIVKIGDIAVADQKTIFSGNRIIAKALDDRIGCAVMIEALKNIKDSPNNIYIVFTTQEELGLRGAKTSSFGIAPDFGLALDVTLTGDTPEAKRMDVKLGGGTAIKIKDSSLITNPKVVQFLIDIAEKENIKYQLEVLERGGTDAGAINLTKGGILAGCLSIPCRYVHSPSEMVDMGDVEATRDLLIKFLESKLIFL